MTVFDNVTREIDTILAREGPNSLVGDEARALFERVVEERAHIEKLNSVLGRLDTPEVIAMAGSRDYLLLHSTPYSTWAFTRRRGTVKTISLTPVLSISTKLDSSRCSVRRYGTSHRIDNAIFDPKVHLVDLGDFDWRSGAIIVKDSIEQLHGFEFSGDDGPVYLRVNSSLIGDFEWVFDLGSGKVSRHVCVSPGDSNLVTMLDLLGDAGGKASIDFILPYVESPLHFVRWKAVSVISRIDEAVGISLIKAATRDPHPEIREAACLSLNQRNAA